MVLTKLVFIILILSCINLSAQQTEKLVLPKILSNGEVILGKNILTEIKKINPDFKILNRSAFSKRSVGITDNHPMAVTADFNSDGYRDIALYGFVANSKSLIIYVAISDIKKRKYNIKEAYKIEVRTPTIQNLSSYLTKSELKSKNKKRDVFLLENYEPGFMSSVTYYYSFKTKTVLPYVDRLD